MLNRYPRLEGAKVISTKMRLDEVVGERFKKLQPQPLFAKRYDGHNSSTRTLAASLSRA